MREIEKRPFAAHARHTAARYAALALSLALLIALPLPALAAAHDTATVDKIADVLSVFVIIAVPIVGVGLFLMVHVLPEKIAERRHHPQKDAITTLCLLSLAFGGMLWPLAWLWAFTKPIGHKMAYGTDKSDTYYHERGRELDDRSAQGEDVEEEVRQLLRELDAMDAQHPLSDGLKKLRRNLTDFQDIKQKPAEADRPVEADRPAETDKPAETD